ncbi:Gfo/Idh/MocA family protein [Streptomyces litchfieldiae]|uniref:Gfo/Idh/MocA family oxidoreductase n=1 Tax=Streptomyces litchfieldiae TaxID=3075543 RepID=A0ABU2MPG5_9ACTN|nr:Gfo/Idh/MocA family oxidoreductase [Streptomyces sp. DSM 44938]MDT0343505.1 Gfo/Idh/MocA family oxidoreductase [Streptomyces sp. DSM 44938]
MTSPTSTDGGRKRYALIGTGHRGREYARGLCGEYRDVAELAALLDPNPGRLDFYQDLIAGLGTGAAAPTGYESPDDLERMIGEQRIERVVVTAPDHAHADLVARSLRAGADVIVEKPLATDADGTRLIVDALNESGRDLVITFNYRYSPRNAALRELVASGAVGEVTSVQFEWVLDTSHGADYFRRWHREKPNSGGLLVHKASHHFDLVNWWIDDVPSRVYASGGLRFYGAANAARRSLGPRPERGTTENSAADPFLLDLRSDETLRRMYLEAEHHDGYLRDRDVFGEGITIEDNLALVVDYAGGPSLSYGLNAHSPWEGYRVAINGTEGRAELDVVERAAVITDAARPAVVDPSAVKDAAAVAGAREESERLILQRHWEPAREVEIPQADGGHGGGDAELFRALFREGPADPLGRAAGIVDGIRAVSVGIAGNRSLATGLPVTVADLDLGDDRLP